MDQIFGWLLPDKTKAIMNYFFFTFLQECILQGSLLEEYHNNSLGNIFLQFSLISFYTI